MKKKIIGIFICLMLITITTFTAVAQTVEKRNLSKHEMGNKVWIDKVKRVPVPWQTWFIDLDNLIVFDNITLHEDNPPVWIKRDYVTLNYTIPLEMLLWEEQENLPWIEVPWDPTYLEPGDKDVFGIGPITEDTQAVLVRYTVSDNSSKDIMARFINELTIEDYIALDAMTNFDFYNTYTEEIDNFELELHHSDLVKNDIWDVYPGWGVTDPWTDMVIQHSYGLEIIWKGPNVPQNDKRHLGITINPDIEDIHGLGWLTIQRSRDATPDIDSTRLRNKLIKNIFLNWLGNHPKMLPILQRLTQLLIFK